MNKKLFFIFLFALLFLPSSLAVDVGFIVKNPDWADTKITSLLDGRYSYDLIDDSAVPYVDFSDYEMILVWDEPLDNVEYIPVGIKKSLLGNSYYVEDWKIAKYAGVSVGNPYGRIIEENIITDGFISPLKLYTSNNINLFTLPLPYRRAPGIENIVSTDNYKEYPVIGIMESGGRLYNTQETVSARTAFFGITETDYWTDNTEELFINTLYWVMTGDDKDGDGFYTDYDCDDSNPNINPDAGEIPYDGIDQDCDGNDWVDVDGDGYDAEPFGNDCDDSDSTINPGSSDILKNCINDIPSVFEIPDITWEEDTALLNYLDLNDYFYDDSELIYSVSGNNHINIAVTHNGLVSFYPDENWFGEETIRFRAYDGEFYKYSNYLTLKLIDANEPPEFLPLTCSLNILEDEEYWCELNAEDYENDSLIFSIVSENNLNCWIENDNLYYLSFLNYNGPASCVLRVSDTYGYDEFLLDVDVLQVNDPPEIVSYLPRDNQKLLENTNKMFSVIASDVDSNFSIKWLLKGEMVGEESNYLFNQPKGSYDLEVEVSDGEYFVDHFWNIFVGDLSDFTCDEINGYVCEENEICSSENILEVKGEGVCCIVPCSPSFKRIDRCESLENDIEIEIKKPDKGDDLLVGDDLTVKARITNKLEEDLRFNVEVYLYDIDRDKVIEDDSESIKVAEGDSESVEFKFSIPEDLDESRDYAVFVKARRGDYCNEEYSKVDIDRKDEDVIIEKLTLPNEGKCGNYANIRLNVKNKGSDEQENVYVVVENSELEIYEKSSEFDLEEYGEHDEEFVDFSIELPESEGSYELNLGVFFNGESYFVEHPIRIICEPDVEIMDLESISLTKKMERFIELKDNKMLTLGIIISIAVLIFIIFLFYVIVPVKQK